MHAQLNLNKKIVMEYINYFAKKTMAGQCAKIMSEKFYGASRRKLWVRAFATAFPTYSQDSIEYSNPLSIPVRRV